MAELLSPQRLSDIRAFEREWIALRECVSPRTDKQQQYLTAIDWRRLLLLAREHGVLGQLAACLADRQMAKHRSEEPTSELQAPDQVVCRLPLEKKKQQ